MPHSSGGGSFGGGSHFGGGGGSSNTPRVSRRPYPGARRFVYYMPAMHCYRYYYYDGTPSRPRVGQLIFIILIGLVCLTLAGFIFRSETLPPEKIDTAGYDAVSFVEDKTGKLGDTQPLEDALLRFRAATGVTPAAEFISESTWVPYYDTLSAYAYNEYVLHFPDEKHWLFVFSLPEDFGASEMANWSWEGMLGDEVGNVIGESDENAFTEQMQKALIRSKPEELQETIAKVLDEFGVSVMQPGGFSEGAVPVAAFGIFGVLFLAAGIADYRNKKRLYGAIPVAGEPTEAQCSGCGHFYVRGTVTTCPYCGAGCL